MQQQQQQFTLRAEMGNASILPALQNAFMKQQGERVSK